MWAAFEVGIVVPRQNGKNAILTARELAGIVLFGEDLIIHSAHRADATLEQFRKIEQLADEFDELRRLVKRVSRVNGHEHIELKGNRRINFVSRARNPGRGFAGACVVLDEAFNLDPSAIGAMVPTLSTRSTIGAGVQVWYTSSAPHDDSIVLHGVRTRGRSGKDADRLFYAEWGNDADVRIDDLDAVYAANPGAGIRISEDYLLAERELMSAVPGEYVRERLGVAEELASDAGESPIPLVAWEQVTCPESVAADEVPRVFAMDSSQDRRWSSVAVATFNAEGAPHVEVVEHCSGVAWLRDRLVGLLAHGPVTVQVDSRSPARSVVAGLEADGVSVEVVAEAQVAARCGALVDAVRDRAFAYRPVVDAGAERDGDPHMAVVAALASARQRKVGDGWAWSRRDSASDITPLVAMTLAFGALPAARHDGGGFTDLDDYLADDDDE